MTDELEKLRKELQSRSLEVVILKDALAVLVDRYAISAEELAQLNVGTVARKEGGKAEFTFHDLEDMKNAIDFAMKNQATVAKFRQLKAHFLVHQAAVSALLDRMTFFAKQNYLTTSDMRRIAEIRDELAALIGRKI